MRVSINQTIDLMEPFLSSSPSNHFSDDCPDCSEVLSMYRDPDPFLCDVASVIDSCIRDPMSERSENPENTDDSECVSVGIVSSSSGEPFVTKKRSSGSKKSGKKRVNPLRVKKSYICDWCDRKASFKSGQGLRFHKTLRCPKRESHLGQSCLLLLYRFV